MNFGKRGTLASAVKSTEELGPFWYYEKLLVTRSRSFGKERQSKFKRLFQCNDLETYPGPGYGALRVSRHRAPRRPRCRFPLLQESKQQQLKDWLSPRTPGHSLLNLALLYFRFTRGLEAGYGNASCVSCCSLWILLLPGFGGLCCLIWLP